MKKHCIISSYYFQHALLSVSVTLCFAKMVTFLVRSRVCCAVVPNGLKTPGPWPSAFSNNSTVAADLPGKKP